MNKFSSQGDLEHALHIGEYSKTHEIQNVNDFLSISMNVHDEGNVLEIVGMCSKFEFLKKLLANSLSFFRLLLKFYLSISIELHRNYSRSTRNQFKYVYQNYDCDLKMLPSSTFFYYFH